MSESHFAFTKTNLTSLRPSAVRVYYHDTNTSGLCLCVTPTATKTFYYLKKILGKTVRVRIGRFPELTVDQARTLAKGHALTVAAGENPQEKKRQKRAEPTFGELWEAWEKYAEGHKKAKSVKEDKRQYGTYLEDKWGATRLSAIRTSDVQSYHLKLGEENGRYQANRVLALIRSMFNNAEELVGWPGANPARKVKDFPEVSRSRFLQPDELPQFFTALDAEPCPILSSFFYVCLFTGQRRGVVQQMQWADVDLEAQTWTIAGEKQKNGDPIVVPLVPQAIAALEDLRRRLMETKPSLAQSEFVFPATRRGKKGTPYLTDPMPAWRRILKRADLKDIRIHDLRRSLGSWQANSGTSLHIIGKSLGHRDPNTTQIYARLNIDPVRASMERAVGEMCKARKVSETSDT